MTAIDKLIQTADNEVGYLEKSSNSQLDDKTANAGMNNYTKYWRDIKTNIKDSRGVRYLLHGVSPRLSEWIRRINYLNIIRMYIARQCRDFLNCTQIRKGAILLYLIIMGYLRIREL